MMSERLFIVWLNKNNPTPSKIPTNTLCPKLADLIFEWTNGVVNRNIIKHDKGIENFDQNANSYIFASIELFLR